MSAEVEVDDEVAELADRLVDAGFYETRSEAVEDALDRVIDEVREDGWPESYSGGASA